MKVFAAVWLSFATVSAIATVSVIAPVSAIAQDTRTGQVATPSGRPAITIPDDIASRDVDIWSEGTRMTGTIYVSKSAKPDAKLPTILMAHGWGGQASGAIPDAVLLAHNGFLCLAFDYRGWGRSDSRVILTGKPPAEKTNNRFTAEVQEVRQVVEPIAMAIDWQNALLWAKGEPQVDANRIGLWGTSFSGGLVVYVAARDPSVKAVFSQIGAFDGRPWGNTPELFAEAIKRARGEIGYPAPLARYEYKQAGVTQKLNGWPMAQQFLEYAPVEEVKRMGDVPTLFVIAGAEELFDNKDHGLKAYERHIGPDKKILSIPGLTHYDVYRNDKGRPEANKNMLEWFNKYLKR